MENITKRPAFTWAGIWGSVVIFRSQKGPRPKNNWGNTTIGPASKNIWETLLSSIEGVQYCN